MTSISGRIVLIIYFFFGFIHNACLVVVILTADARAHSVVIYFFPQENLSVCECLSEFQTFLILVHTT